jgi:integrase
MPKRAKELSALDLKRLTHPGGDYPVNVAVGGVTGLNIQITPSNAKSWILRATVGGKRRMIGLGGYPDVSLAQARERARETRDAIWHGVDPIAERQAAQAALRAEQARAMTFKDAFERFMETKDNELGDSKEGAKWRSTIETYALPVLGKMPVSEIEVRDILRVLEPIWLEKTNTAQRLRGRIEAILAWATVGGYRTGDNPARWKGNLDVILPKPSRVAAADNRAAVALADVPDWFKDVMQRDTPPAKALAFIAMTACRSGEVRGMRWSEVDLESGIWTIPAERMKQRTEHRIPLSSDALALLRNMPQDGELVFPSARGKEMYDAAISKVMREVCQDRYLDRRSGRPAVPHGLRSTFRDWAAERTEYPREMAEIALAHTVGSEAERAYRRSDMMERRRVMMEAWGRFLRGEQGNKVVRIGASNG